MRLVILFDIPLNPSFKMTTRFANIARTTASTSKLCTRKDFKWNILYKTACKVLKEKFWYGVKGCKYMVI